MPKVNKNLQITLPATGCEELGLRPGDEVVVLRYRDQFNIRKNPRRRGRRPQRDEGR